MASSSRKTGLAVSASGPSVEASCDRDQTAPLLIEDLPGLKAEHARCLHSAGLLTVESFLENARSSRERMFLAAKTGLSARQILEFINLVDLCRIDGLSHEAIQLLRSHGVHTSRDLAGLDPEFLVTLLSSEDSEGLEDESPNFVKLVYCWIAQARELPRLFD